jgi:hypothetical protein
MLENETIINKGTGAGGAKTNKNGLSFENKTSIETKLSENKFEKIIMNKKMKNGYYFELKNNDDIIIYLTKSGFKLYFKEEFNIKCWKEPDEAFLIFSNNKYYLKILEKKNQNGEGSVEEKLKTGQFTRREYEKMLNNPSYKFNISYAFCISKYLQNKLESNKIKYTIMKELMLEDNIKIFYGDDDNYLDIVYEWINKK